MPNKLAAQHLPKGQINTAILQENQCKKFAPKFRLARHFYPRLVLQKHPDAFRAFFPPVAVNTKCHHLSADQINRTLRQNTKTSTTPAAATSENKELKTKHNTTDFAPNPIADTRQHSGSC